MQTGKLAWGKEEQNRSTVSDNDVVISGKSPQPELSKAIISTLRAGKLRHRESDLFTVTCCDTAVTQWHGGQGQVPWCVRTYSHHQSSWCKPIAINPAAVSCLFSALPIFSAPSAALERHLELGWSHCPAKPVCPAMLAFLSSPQKSHVLLRTQSHLGSCMGCVGKGICFAGFFCVCFFFFFAGRCSSPFI